MFINNTAEVKYSVTKTYFIMSVILRMFVNLGYLVLTIAWRISTQ